MVESELEREANSGQGVDSRGPSGRLENPRIVKGWSVVTVQMERELFRLW